MEILSVEVGKLEEKKTFYLQVVLEPFLYFLAEFEVWRYKVAKCST